MSRAVQSGLIGVLLVGSVVFGGEEFKLGKANAAKTRYESAVREVNKKRDEALERLRKTVLVQRNVEFRRAASKLKEVD